MKPHTISEELVKPAAVDMVRTVCGGDVARKIEQIPLSNDTIRARICEGHQTAGNTDEWMLSKVN